MVRFSVPLLVLAAFLVTCSTGNGVPETTGVDSEPASASEAFIGTWSLVSWTSASDAGEKSYPFGEDAFGRIIYHPNGRMMVTLMRRNRPALSTDDVLQATVDDLRMMAGGFFAYTGTYVVDAENQTVTHRIEACASPNWVGTDRVRHFKRIGTDKIILRTPEDAVRHEIAWQREE